MVVKMQKPINTIILTAKCGEDHSNALRAKKTRANSVTPVSQIRNKREISFFHILYQREHLP
jgi:hypothetical protein